jgi:hypothetical protein
LAQKVWGLGGRGGMTKAAVSVQNEDDRTNPTKSTYGNFIQHFFYGRKLRFCSLPAKLTDLNRFGSKTTRSNKIYHFLNATITEINI